MSDAQDEKFISWAADIVSAYVSNNSVPASELPNLINSIHASLAKISAKVEEPAKQPATPPVPIKKSVTDEYLICLEDGKRFKSLKRHLQTVYGMTPDDYREKWGLSRDYPMVAPAYAKARSALAKEMGLGASRRKPAEPIPANDEDRDSEPAVESQIEEPASAEPAVEVDVEAAPAAKKQVRRRKTAKAEA